MPRIRVRISLIRTGLYNSILITFSSHYSARDLQEYIFEVGFRARKSEQANAAIDEVFEKVVNVVRLTCELRMNRSTVAGCARNFRSLRERVKRQSGVAFHNNFYYDVARKLGRYLVYAARRKQAARFDDPD